LTDIINFIGEKTCLPRHIIDEGISIYNDNMELGKNWDDEVLQVSSLYMACRIHGIPRTMGDFCYAGNITRQILFDGYTRLFNTSKYKVVVMNPLSYLNRITSMIGVDPRTSNFAQNLLITKSKQCSLIGHDPIIRAGSVLYISCVKNGFNITQKDIAEVCQCSESSIRVNSKKLMDVGILED